MYRFAQTQNSNILEKLMDREEARESKWLNSCKTILEETINYDSDEENETERLARRLSSSSHPPSPQRTGVASYPSADNSGVASYPIAGSESDVASHLTAPTFHPNSSTDATNANDDDDRKMPAVTTTSSDPLPTSTGITPNGFFFAPATASAPASTGITPNGFLFAPTTGPLPQGHAYYNSETGVNFSDSALSSVPGGGSSQANTNIFGLTNNPFTSIFGAPNSPVAADTEDNASPTLPIEQEQQLEAQETGGTQETEATTASESESLRAMNAFRRRVLLQFYEEVNPEKATDGQVDRLLDKYDGDFSTLVSKLANKYPEHQEFLTQLVAPGSSSTVPAADPAPASPSNVDGSLSNEEDDYQGSEIGDFSQLVAGCALLIYCVEGGVWKKATFQRYIRGNVIFTFNGETVTHRCSNLAHIRKL